MFWIASGDCFFVAYLALMVVMASRATAETMRERRAFDDHGIGIIMVVTGGAIVLNLLSLFEVLNERPDTTRVALAIASVPLGCGSRFIPSPHSATRICTMRPSVVAPVAPGSDRTRAVSNFPKRRNRGRGSSFATRSSSA